MVQSSAGALALLSWTFEHEGCLYPTKYGNWYDHWKYFCPIFLLFYETYIEGKQHRVVIPNEGGRQATKPLEIVYFDVCGLMRTTSMGGIKYFVTFIDKFSKKI